MGLSVAACTRMSSGRWVRCLVLLSRSSREALIRASLEFPVCWLHHARRDARAQRATRNTHHAYTYMWCVMSQSNGCGAAACQRVLLVTTVRPKPTSLPSARVQIPLKAPNSPHSLDERHPRGVGRSRYKILRLCHLQKKATINGLRSTSSFHSEHRGPLFFRVTS